MKVDREERLTNRPARTSLLPFIIGAVVIAAIVLWFVFKPGDQPADEPVTIIEQEVTPTLLQQEDDPLINQAPDIPERIPEAADGLDGPVEPELPELSASDDFTREQLIPLSESDELAQWLGTDDLLPKAAAVIDGLARGVLVKKVLPMEAPGKEFKVSMEQDMAWMDESNYTRYNRYVSVLTSVPPEALASTFHTLRPLLEKAYGDLGGDTRSLDNRVIAAIDRMLLTPDHNGPFALERESVYYQFVDPTLEALPDIQKQLLRIGPDNRAKLKNYLRELRVALLAESPGADNEQTP